MLLFCRVSYKMASGALFGNAASRAASNNLVEFRAGKMSMKGKMVHPDKRKGQVYIYQSDDSLIHFCWKDRTNGSVEDDLIIFPDDCEFKHVKQCTTGRVYMLKFKSSSRKLFFWLQEAKSDKDEETCKKVNEMLNNPPAPGSRPSAGSGGGLAGLEGLGDGELQSMLGGMNQQQLMQLLGGLGVGGMQGLGNIMNASRGGSAASNQAATETTSPIPAVPPPSTTRVTTSTTPAPAATPQPTHQVIELRDLENILQGITFPPGQAEGQSGPNIDLSTALTPEMMAPILRNPEIQQQLSQHLPPGLALDPSELQATMTSPQFQQAMGVFTAALRSGQLGPLMGQFDLGEEVVKSAEAGDVEKFLLAMQKSQANSAVSSDNKEKGDDEEKSPDKTDRKDGDDDDSMALD